MNIRVLPEHIINQICAGEVAERPATILKELLENALDAGATEINIQEDSGGKNKLIVSDNGSGMSRIDLEKSILRHATSKIPDENLFNICSFGFRGEALASIASASRLIIRTNDGESGWEMTAEAGKIATIKPIAHQKGTTIIVKDLFYATPARLKFLKSDQSEKNAISETVKRIALAHPDKTFSLNETIYVKGSLSERIHQVLGEGSENNFIEISHAKNGYSVSGVISKPTYYRHNSRGFYTYVNSRFMQDKFIFSLVRQAYADVVAHDRYPIVVLNIQVPEKELDVNVHPAKTEIRFLNQSPIRDLVVSALKKELGKTLHETPTYSRPSEMSIPLVSSASFQARESAFSFQKPAENKLFFEKEDSESYPFGIPQEQLYSAYILSKKEDEWYLIDQHAAHERIVLERLNDKEIISQKLLMPEIVISEPHKIEMILEEKANLSALGFEIERMDITSFKIVSLPIFLKQISPIEIFQKIMDDLEENIISNVSADILHKIKGTIACHGSIRAGQKLSFEEMKALLKQIADTPRAMQCNHGRPTVIKLDRKLLDKFFERS
ncbi:MAG: DNA mismatch repair endonuclease MutL [Alphaproteobacteria bacterium]|nr:DNA mismatch repair endonuclease MutL [Alphaproteobacteria bacterium]